MKEQKQKVINHEYFRVLKEGGAINLTFSWEGRRLILPHWDFVSLLWQTPKVYINFRNAQISFDPPEDFDLEYFLDSFHAMAVTHVYQAKGLRLDVECGG